MSKIPPNAFASAPRAKRKTTKLAWNYSGDGRMASAGTTIHGTAHHFSVYPNDKGEFLLIVWDPSLAFPGKVIDRCPTRAAGVAAGNAYYKVARGPMGLK